MVHQVLGLVDGVHLGQGEVGNGLVNTELIGLLEQGCRWSFVVTICYQLKASVLEDLQFP